MPGLMIEYSIKLISSICIMFGLWLLVGPLILPVFRERLKTVPAIYRKIQQMTDHEKQTMSDNPLIKHIVFLLESTSKRMSRQTIANFIALSTILFAVVAVVIFSVFQDFLFTLTIAVFAGMVPYLLRRMRLNRIRLTSSMQLLEMIPNLLQHYQSTNQDIYFALLRTMEDMETQYLKQILQNLLNHMQINRNRQRLKQKVDLFIFSIQSNLSKRLGRLIFKAYIEKTNITDSLVQLEKDVRRAKQLMEFQKTQGFDTIMLGYASIVTFPGSLILGYYASGPQNYFYYQFQTQVGLSLFIVCTIASLFGIIVATVMRRPKADL